MPDFDTLIVWCRYTNLLDVGLAAELRETARTRSATACQMLDQVRRFRADLYTTLTERDQLAFDRVAEVAQRSASAVRLVGRPDGGAEWLLPPDLGLELPLLRLGRSAAELLVSEERAAVRTCPGEECGWLFLDPRGRRRWCSMQTCGNRAKAKAFAARQRHQPSERHKETGS